MSIYFKKYTDRINKHKKALQVIKTWDDRIKAIKQREKDSMSESAFCRKHGINHFTFNIIKNGTYAGIPSVKMIKKIESAFKKEGV